MAATHDGHYLVLSSGDAEHALYSVDLFKKWGLDFAVVGDGRLGEHHVIVEIESLVVEGNFPPRAVGLVLAWARLHRVELAENWERARAGEPLRRIPPLE